VAKVQHEQAGSKDFLKDPFANEKWPSIMRGLVTDTPADTFLLLAVSVATLQLGISILVNLERWIF
jgi:hypothetical protein